MTVSPFEDCVAIDTNVFEHLLNLQMNIESHINELLAHLQEQEVALVVDSGRRILNEYDNRLEPILRNIDNSRVELYILRYWTRYVAHHDVTVDQSDALMGAIRGVIPGNSEGVDRIFVYVAFQSGSVLISNDETHIVVGPPGERGQRPRRDRLRSTTGRLRPAGADILTSMEAYEKIR